MYKKEQIEVLFYCLDQARRAQSLRLIRRIQLILESYFQPSTGTNTTTVTWGATGGDDNDDDDEMYNEEQYDETTTRKYYLITSID
jgi:hypothetical protein